MSTALKPYLKAVTCSLKAALCLQNFPSMKVECHNKPEIELMSAKEAIMTAVVISRNERQKVKIEPSINSTRISIKIQQMDELDTVLVKRYTKFLMLRAEQFKILRRVAVDGYDISFLITNAHTEVFLRDELVNFIIEFISAIDSEFRFQECHMGLALIELAMIHQDDIDTMLQETWDQGKRKRVEDTEKPRKRAKLTIRMKGDNEDVSDRWDSKQNESIEDLRKKALDSMRQRKRIKKSRSGSASPTTGPNRSPSIDPDLDHLDDFIPQKPMPMFHRKVLLEQKQVQIDSVNQQLNSELQCIVNLESEIMSLETRRIKHCMKQRQLQTIARQLNKEYDEIVRGQ